MKSIHKVVNGKLTNADQLVSNLDKFEGKVVTIDVKNVRTDSRIPKV